MNIWKSLSKLCSATPWTKRWSLQAYYKWKKLFYLRSFAKKEETQEKTVIFEAYMAKKYACSPKALYEAMCADKKYDSWRKIWAFREPEKFKYLEKKPNTEVVGFRTVAYYRAYAQAKYWITNSRLPRELEPKQEQEYIQCWHGTPLKKLGFDLVHYTEKGSTLEEVRDNYWQEARRITGMPSPSPFYTEKMISAFHLKEAGKTQVFTEWGYPRNDRLFSSDEQEIPGIREKLGIPGGKKVILYAPTWRENQHVPGEAYRYRLEVDFDKWKKALGSKYIVLFRAHYLVAEQYDFSRWKDFVYNVSDRDDVNDLYLVSDVLITDYSSVFFDFANLVRPILFYMYDYEAYRKEMRDFYFEEELLPGPVIRDEEKLLQCLSDISAVEKEYSGKYEKFNRTFNPHRECCSQKYLEKWMG